MVEFLIVLVDRFIRKVGVVCVSEEVVKVFVEYFEEKVLEIVKKVVVFVQYVGRKIVKVEDIKFVIKS